MTASHACEVLSNFVRRPPNTRCHKAVAGPINELTKRVDAFLLIGGLGDTWHKQRLVVVGQSGDNIDFGFQVGGRAGCDLDRPSWRGYANANFSIGKAKEKLSFGSC